MTDSAWMAVRQAAGSKRSKPTTRRSVNPVLAMPRAAKPMFSGLSGRTSTTANLAADRLSLTAPIIAEDRDGRKPPRSVDTGGRTVL
jgi:hypothetical protein